MTHSLIVPGTLREASELPTSELPNRFSFESPENSYEAEKFNEDRRRGRAARSPA